MIGLAIADVKDFMSKVLVKNTFDKFYVCESELQTLTMFKFGGHLNTAYYSSDEQEGLEGRIHPLWSELKPFVYQVIRGKKLPVSFHFVFQLSDENLRWLLEHNRISVQASEIGGLYMNIKYENKSVTCITGTSFKTFVMDRSLEQLWDATVLQFMKQNEIAVEQL